MLYYVSTFALLIYTVDASQMRLDSRIVGGSMAPENFFPYIVSLRLNQIHVCGGSIIRKMWVLSAAHCVEKPGKYEIEYGANTHGEGVRIDVQKIVIHPNYIKEDLIENDIALLKVSEKFKFSKEVKIIELNTKPVPLGMNGMISGWGDSTGWGDYPDRLQMANISIVSCPGKYRYWRHIVCVQNQDAAGCYGDSGGPLEVDGTLAGVTSFRTVGVQRTVTCKPNDISAYTNVEDYLEWIEDST